MKTKESEYLNITLHFSSKTNHRDYDNKKQIRRIKDSFGNNVTIVGT